MPAKPALDDRALADFLGIDLAASASSQPENRDVVSLLAHDGWPIDPGSPVARHLAALFPMTADHASLALNRVAWCFVSTSSRSPSVFVPTIDVRFEAPDWTGPVQQVYAPAIPLVVEGKVTVGKRALSSPDALDRWYTAELARHKKGVLRRLSRITTTDVLKTLYPHDVWTAG